MKGKDTYKRAPQTGSGSESPQEGEIKDHLEGRQVASSKEHHLKIEPS